MIAVAKNNQPNRHAAGCHIFHRDRRNVVVLCSEYDKFSTRGCMKALRISWRSSAQIKSARWVWAMPDKSYHFVSNCATKCYHFRAPPSTVAHCYDRTGSGCLDFLLGTKMSKCSTF